MHRFVAAVSYVLFPFAVVTAAEVTGTVEARTSGGARGTAIVFAEPLEGVAPNEPQKVRLQQRDKRFTPAVLAVPIGSTVDFPNLDPIFHNVFSLSSPQPFDLGLYRAGSSKSRTFTRPGYYWVFCNIHPQMAAFLAVVPSPWVTLADERGAYRLDLPRGRYRLTALSERAAPASVEIEVGSTSGAVPVLRLDETRWVGITHKNKFGQDYPASAYETSKSQPH
jgi:plastocyanin